MATPTDVSKLSLDDLDLLIKDATQRRDELIDEKRKGLLAELAKLDALSGKATATPKQGKTRAASRYTHVHPKNGHQWLGRGGVPQEWSDIVNKDDAREVRQEKLKPYRTEL